MDIVENSPLDGCSTSFTPFLVIPDGFDIKGGLFLSPHFLSSVSSCLWAGVADEDNNISFLPCSFHAGALGG